MEVMRMNVEFSAICEFGHLRLEELEGSEDEDCLLECNFLLFLWSL